MVKWVRRILLGTAAIIIVPLVVGVTYEQRARRTAVSNYPPPGELVEHDGRVSHLLCSGDGFPTVILEAGLGVAGSPTWAAVQPEIAENTRVCSYDRAGILWSEPRGEPRDAHRIVDELHALLDAAGLYPPYVMVGHSLGGILIRVYDSRFPGEVAGFVFVDASHPEQFDRYPTEIREALSELDPRLPPRVVQRVLAITGAYRRFILPPPRDAVSAFLPRTVPWGFASERAARDAMSEQAAATRSLDSRPLIILTAGVGPRYPGVSEEGLAEFYVTWRALQAELASLSSNSAHRVIEGATHNIHLDEPQAVVLAVWDVVNAVRQGVPLGRE